MDCSRDCRSPRRGFTLVELLVVISIVILLMAILLPTLGAIQSERRQLVCANNLRNLGLGLSAATRAGHTIESTNWAEDILPYVNDDTSLTNCPEHGSLTTSYGMSNRAHRIVLLDYHTTEANIVVRDINDQDVWSKEASTYAARHADRVNVLLHSGSVQARTAESIDPRTTDVWLANWRPHRDTFVISGAVESGVLVSGSTKYENATTTASSSRSSLRPAAMTSPPDYPPLDPENFCNYESFINLDNSDGTSGEHTFNVVYDEVNNGYGCVDIFGLNFCYNGGYFASKTRSNSIRGNVHQAWGYQTDGTKAVYEFNDLESGEYKVWVHWPNSPNYASGVPHHVYDGSLTAGGDLLYSENINQQSQPSSSPDKARAFSIDGSNRYFYQLGDSHQIDSGTLRLEITANAGGIHPDNDPAMTTPNTYEQTTNLVVADAVRISCATDPSYVHGRCVDEAPRPSTTAIAVSRPQVVGLNRRIPTHMEEVTFRLLPDQAMKPPPMNFRTCSRGPIESGCGGSRVRVWRPMHRCPFTRATFC